VDFEDIKKYVNEVMKNIDADTKKNIYEGGREVSVKAKTIWFKIWYFATQSAYSSYIAGGLLLVVFYFFIVAPYLNRGSSIGIAPGYEEKQPEFTLFDNSPKPTRDCQTQISFFRDTVLNGQKAKEEIPVWVDAKGRVFIKNENADDIKVRSTKKRVDWRLQPGIGVLIVPTEDASKNWLQPALFISPVEFFNVADLDIYVNHRRFGGGASFKLPWSWTRNSYIGGGVTVPYSSLVTKEFVISLKINF